jgi:death on curing protein
MIQLTKSQVVSMHSSLVAATGGSDGIRDDGMLESAMNAPFQTFDGYDLYPTLLQKAARLGYSLVNNHPFVDGNKRIGIHAMLVFLLINGVEIECTQEELIEVGLALADGSMECEKLFDWLTKHN